MLLFCHLLTFLLDVLLVWKEIDLKSLYFQRPADPLTHLLTVNPMLGV